MALSNAVEIRQEFVRLKCEGDPARQAAMRLEYARKVDALFDLSLHWTSVFLDAEAEYIRKIGKLQLEFEKKGQASTPAESRARAMCREEKISVSELRFVKNYYSNLWDAYHKKSPYG